MTPKAGVLEEVVDDCIPPNEKADPFPNENVPVPDPNALVSCFDSLVPPNVDGAKPDPNTGLVSSFVASVGSDFVLVVSASARGSIEDSTASNGNCVVVCVSGGKKDSFPAFCTFQLAIDPSVEFRSNRGPALHRSA